jgi:hypothetical protein
MVIDIVAAHAFRFMAPAFSRIPEHSLAFSGTVGVPPTGLYPKGCKRVHLGAFRSKMLRPVMGGTPTLLDKAVPEASGWNRAWRT